MPSTAVNPVQLSPLYPWNCDIDGLNLTTPGTFKEELYNRLDVISDPDESIYSAELIKFLISPESFGADDIKGQPVKLADKVFTIGSLTQSEKGELYQNYYEQFGKRSAELEAIIQWRPRSKYSPPEGLSFP